MSERPVTSRRPYLLRAMHEWMTDNGQTPFIVVDAELPGVEVPRRHVDDGKIILNISVQATDGLEIGNDMIRFSARFDAEFEHIFIPPAAVLGIYARESGQGMIFTADGDDGGGEPPAGGKPTLRVVK